MNLARALTTRRVALAISMIVAYISAAVAQDSATEITVEPLLSTTTTIIGQPLVYPTEGQAEISASIITVPPGISTGWHIHPTLLFAYVLEGELTVEYDEHETRVYQPGDSLMEATDLPHDGTSTGDVPARVLAVYIGTEGLAHSELTETPHH